MQTVTDSKNGTVANCKSSIIKASKNADKYVIATSTAKVTQ